MAESGLSLPFAIRNCPRRGRITAGVASFEIVSLAVLVAHLGLQRPWQPPFGKLRAAPSSVEGRQTAGGVTYTYQASTLRLLSQNSQTFGYDDAGNMTAAGSNTFTYTPEHQMDTATVGGVTTTYGYDGDGWRATTSRPERVSDYLRGPGGELLAEVHNPGTPIVARRDYIYAGSRLLAVTGDVAAAVSFADDPLKPKETPVRALHLTQLRDAVDAFRKAAGLDTPTWTDAPPAGEPIRSVHIMQLRQRLNAARAALGYPPATFEDGDVEEGDDALKEMPVRAIHFTQLRAALQQPGVNGILRYYHSDVVGSVRMTTDAAGAVVVRYDYQPFGEEWPSPNGNEPRKFTGAERDAESGFDYLGARYLSSGIGRFTRPDDPGYGDPYDPQSMNLYSYARNNPLRFVDPTGHQSCPPPTDSSSCVEGNAGTGELVFDFNRWILRDLLQKWWTWNNTQPEVMGAPLGPPIGRIASGLLSGSLAGLESRAAGLTAATRLGRAGEIAVGAILNSNRIPSASGTAAYRIPDILNHSSRGIGEVKNVGSLSYTNQLRDFATYAQRTGYSFELWVRPTTQLTGPLQQAIARGDIILRFIP